MISTYAVLFWMTELSTGGSYQVSYAGIYLRYVFGKTVSDKELHREVK